MDNKIMPIVRKVMNELGDSNIVATRKSPDPRMITHNGEIVGVYNEDKSIEWFDTVEAKEAKLILEKK
jgi:hypothetical protein